MLGKPLDFDPGERYAYSNYGYCLLGRVIEKLTGQGYEAYVRENVLAPVGVTEMRIGATRLEDRQPNEVRYYDSHLGDSVFAEDLGQPVSHPYGAWHLEAMDSHGAWVASATDLVKFASAFDSTENSPLLSQESIRAMFERPDGLAGYNTNGVPKERFYGLGWSIVTQEDGGFTTSHGGSLPGTNTLLMRRPDGRNFAILFNTRHTAHTSRIVNAVLPQLTEAINAIEDWSKHGLPTE
jgi:N-acyl-D-amino-acid deacylase